MLGYSLHVQIMNKSPGFGIDRPFDHGNGINIAWHSIRSEEIIPNSHKFTLFSTNELIHKLFLQQIDPTVHA